MNLLFVTRGYFKFVRSLSRSTSSGMRLLSQEEAQAIDQELFDGYGFSVDQLMELAGQACAHAIFKAHPPQEGKSALVVCGPGNNGGDGLVCARHLHVLNPKFNPVIFYPKPNKKDLFQNLVRQCRKMNIQFVEDMPSQEDLKKDYSLVIDGLFGFSYVGPPRPSIMPILEAMANTEVPVASIDIPSGWHVEDGDVDNLRFQPHTLISLTAPKMCAKHFTGQKHFLGGRFVPEIMIKERNLDIPPYPGLDQIQELPKSQ